MRLIPSIALHCVTRTPASSENNATFTEAHSQITRCLYGKWMCSEVSPNSSCESHPAGLFVRVLRCLIAASLLFPISAATAPFQAATTITGAPFRSDGAVTIVHYWATWCAPCRVEMPVLDAYYRRHHAQGLQMLAVSIDQGVSARKLQEVTGKFSFPVARVDDMKMPRRDIPRALPLTRVYDRSGRLVFASKGDGRSTIDMATLERVVTPLLSRG
jgi:cytochrome c biogenesis protein CcmG/thiol:disulfide interchange protein DsbE